MCCCLDRVEISDVELVEAQTFAESLGAKVVGWYHSHPNITVPPSHVDLRTQANYQNMDQHFVGLIFSVFNFDRKTSTDTKEAIAFQTTSGGDCRYVTLAVGRDQAGERMEEMAIQAVTSIPGILKVEEEEEYDKMTGTRPDPLTLLHNRAVLLSQLAKQSALITAPILSALEEREAFLQDELERQDSELIDLRKALGVLEENE